MKCRVVLSICLGILTIILTGCVRVAQWGVDAFSQGTNLPEFTGPEKYIRSVTLHNEFSTVARFDAMWLVPEVRTAYTELKYRRSGRPEEHKQAFLRRQLEENVHFIAFYVLSGQDVILGTDYSEWAVMLDVDGTLYTPVEIAAVELPVEYQAFFGKKYNRFKTVFLIRFDAKAIEIKPDMLEIKLVFRSARKEGVLSWRLDASQLLPTNGVA